MREREEREKNKSYKVKRKKLNILNWDAKFSNRNVVPNFSFSHLNRSQITSTQASKKW